MTLVLRRGETQDLTAINTIYNYYVEKTAITFDITPWSDAKRLTWFESYQTADAIHPLWVANDDNRLLGFAYTSQYSEKAAYAISAKITIYLDPHYQQKGLGTELYQRLFADLAESTFHRIYAHITLPNTPSLKLHQKFGFKQIGVLDQVGFKFERFHSVGIFEKSISSR